MSKYSSIYAVLTVAALSKPTAVVAVGISHFSCVASARAEFQQAETPQVISKDTAFEFGMGDAPAVYKIDGAWFTTVKLTIDGMSKEVPAALKFSLASGAEVPMTHIFFDEFGRDIASLDLAADDALISMPMHCKSVDGIY